MPTPIEGSRKLTVGEIAMLQRIFRNAIRYDKVKVHNGKKYIFFQGSQTVMTPNGEIYYPATRFKEDFHTQRASEQHLFIHEITHVWQYQMGFQVKAQSIGSAFRYGYNYTIKPGMKLSDFPMEGQANIIADYAMYVLYGRPDHYSGSQYKKPPQSLADLQTVLADFIKNPLDKSNLPGFANPLCEANPNSSDCTK
jgi:type VI secretion system secreted protein VgrG